VACCRCGNAGFCTAKCHDTHRQRLHGRVSIARLSWPVTNQVVSLLWRLFWRGFIQKQGNDSLHASPPAHLPQWTRLVLAPTQLCIAKNGGGYTQTGVAKGLKVPCLFMITEVSIRCQKNPEVGIRRIPAYTPPNTPLRPPSSTVYRTRRNHCDAAGALACARRRNDATRCNGIDMAHMCNYDVIRKTRST